MIAVKSLVGNPEEIHYISDSVINSDSYYIFSQQKIKVYQ